MSSVDSDEFYVIEADSDFESDETMTKEETWQIFPLIYFRDHNPALISALERFSNQTIATLESEFAFPRWDQFIYAVGWNVLFFRGNFVFHVERKDEFAVIRSFPLEITSQDSDSITMNPLLFDDGPRRLKIKYKDGIPCPRLRMGPPNSFYDERFFAFTIYEKETLWDGFMSALIEHIISFEGDFQEIVGEYAIELSSEEEFGEEESA